MINEHQKEKFSRFSFKGIRARVTEKGPFPCTEVGTEKDAGIKLARVATVVGAPGFTREPVRVASIDACLLGSDTMLKRESERERERERERDLILSEWLTKM